MANPDEMNRHENEKNKKERIEDKHKSASERFLNLMKKKRADEIKKEQEKKLKKQERSR